MAGQRTYPRTLFNDPDEYVDEALDGMLACFPAYYKRAESDKRVLVRARPTASRNVGVISLGGFGHLPTFAGYVGAGLLDACAVGSVFASPSVIQIVAAARAANRGHGVVAIVGNYGGDVMNSKLATKQLAAEGIELKSIVVADDVASAPFDERNRRRGVAGIVLAIKIAGASADSGADLQRVAGNTAGALKNCRSFGVALAPCILPSAGRPTFEIEPTEMEFGMGIHGEPGTRRGPRQSADRVVEFMVDRLIEDRQESTGGDVALLINSLGATPLEELFIMSRCLFDRLGSAGLTVRWSQAGRFATSMEMSGASITLLDVDKDVLALLEAPADCPFWRV